MKKKKGFKVRSKLVISIGVAFFFFCLAQGQNYMSIKQLYQAGKEVCSNAGLTEEAQSIDAAFRLASNNSLIGLGMMVAIVVGIALVMRKGLFRPLKDISDTVQKISESIQAGNVDLSTRIDYDKADELGVMSNGINGLMTSIESIIGGVVENSGEIDNNTGIIEGSVKVANESSADISAVMQELTSSMEEISATVAIVNDSAHTAGSSVKEMVDATEEMMRTVNELQSRSQENTKVSMKNSEDVTKLINDMEVTMAKAIEDSREVEKINSLTEDILSITSQTNLLALNASIEAARAGEHGKGFAVVADEIRVLADNSKNTATNIQELGKIVVGAVKTLNENVETLMSFVSGQVVDDYKNNVEFGTVYNDEATRIHGEMNRFILRADELNSAIDEMVRNFDQINRAINENTHGVSGVAENVASLASLMGDVAEAVNANKNAVEGLGKSIEKFK